jgi:uncharacterized protein (DUF779 family)
MSEPLNPARITATPAAREAVTALRAARGAPVMFVQSGGCCAGSTPMCFPLGEFILGDVDVLLGDIDGSPARGAFHQGASRAGIGLGGAQSL